MFCRNCGKEISETALFCTGCGTRVEKNESVSNIENENIPVVNQQSEPGYAENAAENAWQEPVAQPQTPDNGFDFSRVHPSVIGQEAAPSDCREENAFEGENKQEIPGQNIVNFNTSDEENPEAKPKKKFGKGKVLAIVAGVILMLGIVGYAVWRPVMYSILPEYYVGSLISNTFDNMTEDFENIEKNVFGFNIDKNEAVTAGIAVQGKENYDEGSKINAELSFTNNPDAKEVAGKAVGVVEKDGKKIEIDGQMFLNDETIGAGFDVKGDTVEIPENVINVAGKDYVVPSKTFGNAFINSEIGKKVLTDDAMDVFRNMDLSYSNLTADNAEQMEPLFDAYTEDFIEFLEECRLGDRKSVDFRVGDDEVSAKKISVRFTAKNVMELAVNIMESTTEDAYMRETYGDEYIRELRTQIEDLEAQIERNESEFEQMSLSLAIVEYDGRIIGISTEIDGGEIDVRATDKDHILNGVKVEITPPSGEAITGTFNANWASEDEEIFAEARVDIEGKTASAKLDINYNTGRFEVKVNAPDGREYKSGGKCSKDGKFSLTLDEIKLSQEGHRYNHSVEYDEWFNESFVESYKAEDMYREYVGSDELYDIYMEDPDYYDFVEWYEDKGSRYADDYISFENWLKDIAYDSEDVKDVYDRETGDYEEFEYELILNVSAYVSQSADVKSVKREQVNLFDMTREDLENMFD